MAQHIPAIVGFLGIELLALVALFIRIKRNAKPLGTLIMFLLDASLGIFVIGDLTYLLLARRTPTIKNGKPPVDDQRWKLTSEKVLLFWAASQLLGIFR